MANNKRQADFIASAEAQEIRKQLLDMLENGKYTTESSYSTDTEQYPDSMIPFIEKHMRYLTTHPSVDPAHYLANLRLMTRVR